jgi:hypothetical protein
MRKLLFLMLFIPTTIFAQEWWTELSLDPNEIQYGLQDNIPYFEDVDDFANFIIKGSHNQITNCEAPVIRMIANIFYNIIDEMQNVQGSPTIIWIILKDRLFYLITIDGEYAVLLQEN